MFVFTLSEQGTQEQLVSCLNAVHETDGYLQRTH